MAASLRCVMSVLTCPPLHCLFLLFCLSVLFWFPLLSPLVHCSFIARASIPLLLAISDKVSPPPQNFLFSFMTYYSFPTTHMPHTHTTHTPLIPHKHIYHTHHTHTHEDTYMHMCTHKLLKLGYCINQGFLKQWD